MKKMLLIATTLLLTFATTATERDFSFSQEIDHSVESISLEEVQVLKDNKRNNCYAYTQCWGGRRIQCQTYGDGCTFFVQQGQYVECNGYNRYGQWVNANAYCN
ncbi:hypothetical protein A9Q84_17000 [Halobacteriovorax marinus]|uniref:Uncharacterized protein n=1 Tax=Halobacteriovorax marinus TaxID=97084 RepID=A0A1Y5F7G2_9BACT|nr:hypothetical protein A9Q84_17000 [Halobacteriovorax marinus]